MAESATSDPPPPTCPICGAAAEAGHLVGDRIVQWLPGEPGLWKDFASMGGSVGTFRGLINRTTLAGIRCRACRRIILQDE
jgi:Domain of unknown function (DUF6487)